jgi:hypothetical protein
MPPITEYRVRIWKAAKGWDSPGIDPVAGAIEAPENLLDRAATIETEHGDGPVLVVAVGGGGVDYGQALNEDYDSATLYTRCWDIDEVQLEIGAADEPDLLLSEFHEVLLEAGVEDPRLLTAEETDNTGRVHIRTSSWYDPKYMRESDSSDDD